MDEKGFLIGIKSMSVLIEAEEKAAFLRQPGNRENITIIETIGIFNQNILPLVKHKGKKYRMDGIEESWTTAMSSNG